jgi:hypothetical protein
MTVQDNRRRFINALRENPFNLKQHFNGSLYRKEKGEESACALGVLCFEFGVDLTSYGTNPEYDPDTDPYNEITRILGFDDNAMSEIWYFNDIHKMSFRQIADFLDVKWFPVVIQPGEITEIR